MIFIKPPPRGTDAQGSGAFGASRGKDKNGKPRKHKGFDYRVKPGTEIWFPFRGAVTKIGYPYRGNFELRYIEIERDNFDRIRYLYVEPYLKKRDAVWPGDPLGFLQKHPATARGMRSHVHVEVRQMQPSGRRKLVDPEKYFEEYWR